MHSTATGLFFVCALDLTSSERAGWTHYAVTSALRGGLWVGLRVCVVCEQGASSSSTLRSTVSSGSSLGTRAQSS